MSRAFEIIACETKTPNFALQWATWSGSNRDISPTSFASGQ